MLVVLLLLSFLLAKAQLPQEYELFIRYRQTGDVDIAYRIIREYPDAVFRDDLLVLLAKREVSRQRLDKARQLLREVNPKNLREELKEELLKLWKDLELDPREGFLKSPVLFREFIPKVKLSVEESLEASEELFRKRYYTEVVALLEPLPFQQVCWTLGRAYRALRERERSVEIFEKCADRRARAELAVIYFEMGMKEKAEEMLSLLKEKDLQSDAFFRMGRHSLNRGSYNEAVAYFQRMEPSYRREFNIGLSLYSLGDYTRALDYFLSSVNYARNAEERSTSYFWAYKTLLHIDKERAGEYLVKASNGNGFYHAVASSMLGLPVASKAIRAVMEDESLPKTAAVIRAVWSAGFPEYARLEAFKRLGQMSSSDILSISRFDPFLAIRLAVRKYGYGSFVYNAVAFPKPYREAVEKASQTYAIEPAMIYAVMRQESLFDPYAVSVAKARGLMQLIDSTAQYMAKREGIRLKNIYDPETNILLGTAYLRYLLDQFNGNIVRTLAGYNAGPTRVKNWQNHSDDYLFIELIPITETRDYVKRVLYNYYVYSELLK
ncbi:MAG: transglycosylase SLT domain-containing protein [Aquificaceae bacterium]|nr:transglycosylase SLT domain-containing protein [Aquificaceae bacterium]